MFGKEKPDPYKDTCWTCAFFFPEDSASPAQGVCHRFPKPETTAVTYWCGEYQDDPGPPKAKR